MSETDDLDAIRERRRRQLLEGTTDGPASGDGDDGTPIEPVHVDSRADFQRFVSTHDIVLADFYADWCGPCKMLEPTVRELAQNTEAAVAKVDVDALPGLAREMQVQGVPSLFLYADGEPVERLVGVQDYGTLESLVEQHAG